MDRRAYLGLVVSSLAGLPGCLSGDPAGDGRTSPTGPTPTEATLALGEPYEHDDGWSLTLADADVHRIALRRGTHVDPVGFPDGQYLRYRVAADGDANGPATGGVLPDPARLEVTLDGRDATPDRRGFWSEPVAGPDSTEGSMVTPVRTASAERATIRWRRPAGAVEWRLPAAVRRAIAHAPDFEVRGFQVPGSVAPGSTFGVTLTVANVGDRDGRFLAELGATTISDTPELRVGVPAGETVEHVERLDPYVPGDADELILVLNWGLDRLERRVPVE